MIHAIRHYTARFLAGTIAALALTVMAGWIFSISWMIRIIPVDGTMQFITAILFLLSAVGLYCMSLAIQDDNEAAHVILSGISLCILLVVAVLSAGRMLGISSGLENLFLQQNMDMFYTTYSPAILPELASFFLVGVAGIISLFPGPLREKLLSYSGGFIVAIGLIIALGQLFNVPVSYEISACPICSLLFILLGLGMIQIYRPEQNQ